VCVLALHFLVLVVRVCPQPLGALSSILLTQDTWVAAKFFGSLDAVWLGLGNSVTHCITPP